MPPFLTPGTNQVQEDASVILTDNLLQMLTKLKSAAVATRQALNCRPRKPSRRLDL